MGVIVTAMIGMGCLGAASTRPTTATRRTDLIRPGEAVGPITLGMAEAELEQAMGKAATVPWNEPPNVREYPAKGVTVVLSKQEPRKVTMVLAGRREGALASLVVGSLPWRSEEGVGMGSTADDIRRAYGEPGSDNQPDPNVDWRLLAYPHRGIQFGVRDGLVAWLAVRRPV